MSVFCLASLHSRPDRNELTSLRNSIQAAVRTHDYAKAGAARAESGDAIPLCYGHVTIFLSSFCVCVKCFKLKVPDLARHVRVPRASRCGAVHMFDSSLVLSTVPGRVPTNRRTFSKLMTESCSLHWCGCCSKGYTPVNALGCQSCSRHIPPHGAFCAHRV